jgi:SAM-dependent methyltransferase
MRNPLAIAKRGARSVLESTNVGYRFLLRRSDDVSGPKGRPSAPWHNAVLRTRLERDEAIAQVQKLGLPVVSDLQKNWDTLAALDCILAETSTSATVLDAGAEVYSRILPWLFLYGYTKLEGINLVFTDRKRLGPIIYKHGDVTSTDYAPETFDAIACLSVVEHGVDLSAYFKEAARILKPGGILITSTDYWQTPIDTRGQQMYGVPVHIFTLDEIEQAIALAAQHGFVLTSKIDLSCDEKVVHWNDVDLDYTFVVFTLRKAQVEGGPVVTGMSFIGES